jgi:hypothetical protein
MNSQYEPMGETEMNELLLELADTAAFRAIVNYAFQRDKLVTDAMRSIDPFKDPTAMARSQGIGTGLFDLRDYVLLLKKRTEEAEKDIEEKSKGKGK